MKKFFLFLSLLILTLILAQGCSRQSHEGHGEIIRPVRYEKVFSQKAEQISIFSGITRANIESRLSFKIQGTIEHIPVDVGEKVTQGQLIAILDSQNYELQVQEIEAALTQQKAQARNTAANYDRIRSLYENNNASLNDLDAARAGYESSKASVQATQKRLEQARLQLSYVKLTAPFDGYISEVTAEENENIPLGHPVVSIAAGTEREVEVSVPESIISQIHGNDPVEVIFSAIPDEIFKATVSEVGISSTSYATTYPVTVRINSSSQKIRPGMAAQITFRFPSQTHDRVFFVPTVSLGKDLNGEFVFVVIGAEDEYGYIHRRQVVTGAITSRGIEVFEGLHEADRVVTAGISKITDKQKVRILPQQD